MSINGTNKRIQLLIKHKKRCFFCERRVFIYSNRCDNYVADDLATVEHLFSRLDIRRLVKNTTVLSCYRCNNNRSKEETRIVFSGYFGNAQYMEREIPEYRNLLILMLLNKQLNSEQSAQESDTTEAQLITKS